MSKFANTNILLAYAVTGGLMMSVSTFTAAQEGTVLEEVVVTAQKREESVQDVGIAITAFSGEQLDTFGFTSSTDIAQLTPGVYLSGNNGGNTLQFTVRGVANPEFADLLETPNAVYVDEGYVATGQGQMFANFDMERVEILKGPQGTLFGRNATGGLIHYITRRPTDEFEAYGDISYGSYDSIRFEGAVSGPLTDGISGRISGFYNTHDGIWDNIFPDQLPGPQPFSAPVINGSSDGGRGDEIWTQDEFAVRGQLLFEWRDDMELLVKGQYAEQNPGSGPYQNIATVAFLDDTDGDGAVDDLVDTRFADNVQTLCEQVNINNGACIDSALDLDPDGVRPGRTTDFFGYDDLDGEGDTTSTDHYQEDYDSVEIWGVTANYKWEMTDSMTLTSITNFAKQDKQQSLDVDSGPAPQFIVANDSEHTWWTQEIRLDGNTDRAKWVAGFYYLNIDAEYIAGLTDTRGGFNVFGGSPVPFGAGMPTVNADAGLISDLQTDSYSVFGQIDYDITDQVTGIFGLRIIQEEKEFSYTNRLYPNLDDRTVDVNQAPIFLGPGIFPGTGNTVEFFPPHEESTSDTLWSGKIGLNWTPTDDLLVYGSVNRGVKAGSFNAPLLTFLTPDQYGYDEEVLVAYETGFKSTLFGGKARFNGAFYYYDYTNYQIFQFIGTSGAVFNADAEFYGIELDVAANPFDNFDIMLGFSWIDATVEDVNVAPSLARDVEPTFTPEYQTSGLARYTWPALLADGDLALQMDFNYASEAFYNINNFGTHEMDSYVVGNARLTWYHPNNKLEAQFFVNNLADEQYQNIGFELSTICGCDERSYGRPRWFGGRIRYSF